VEDFTKILGYNNRIGKAGKNIHKKERFLRIHFAG